MRPIPFCLLPTLVLTVFSCAGPRRADPPPATAALRPDATTTVYIIRHAEKKALPVDDPDLEAAGRERAERLAGQFADGPIDAIYTTQLKRTIQTAAPLARSKGIAPVVVPIEFRAIDAWCAEIARRVCESPTPSGSPAPASAAERSRAGAPPSSPLPIAHSPLPRSFLIVSHSDVIPSLGEALGVGRLNVSGYGQLWTVTLHPARDDGQTPPPTLVKSRYGDAPRSK